MFVLISLILVSLGCISNCQSSNFFEATLGCLQYSTNHGYKHQHPYFPTSRFRHLNVTSNGAIVFRMGVVGPNDGHVRLAPTMFPYDDTEMNEIVLSGWGNTKTVVRRYTRTKPEEQINEIVLKEQSSIGMLSYYRPFMFTVAVHNGGLVQLTRDEDSAPFLEFRDPKLSAKYVGFCNWDKPLVFFYDCPLEIDQRACEGVVFSKK